MNVVDKLEGTLYEIENVLNGLKISRHAINQTLKNKYYSIIYLCQIFELTTEIKILIENNSCSSIPIIFRSIIDCLYSILNMEKDPNFIDRLAYKSVSEEEKRIRLLKLDIEKQNYYLELMQNFENKSKPSDLNKFTAIHGDEKLYRWIFSSLSKTVHNDLIFLENKFFSERNGKWITQYNMGITNFIEINNTVDSIIVCIYLALDTILKIHDMYIDDYSKKIDSMVKNIASAEA